MNRNPICVVSFLEKEILIYKNIPGEPVHRAKAVREQREGDHVTQEW